MSPGGTAREGDRRVVGQRSCARQSRCPDHSGRTCVNPSRVKSLSSDEKHKLLGRFFHHEDKSEEEAKQEDPTPEPTHEEHKHHFLRGLFHKGD